jgi:hypothetical protein
MHDHESSDRDAPAAPEPASPPPAAWDSRRSLLVGCLGIGLLLWARLILVSDMPRMALAEPDESAGHAERAEPADVAEGGADSTVGDADARPASADPARNHEIFPDPHNRHSFTTEPPKSRRNPSD